MRKQKNNKVKWVATIFILILIIASLFYLYNRDSEISSKDPYISYIQHNQYASGGTLCVVFTDQSIYYILYFLTNNLEFDSIELRDNNENNLSLSVVNDIFNLLSLSELVRNNKSGYYVSISDKYILTNSEFDDLRQAIANSSFFEYEDNYHNYTIFDASHRFITIWNEDEKKTVREYGWAAPDGYHQILQIFNDFINSRWHD